MNLHPSFSFVPLLALLLCGLSPLAATGDMTASGQVRPIGGLTGKIRGAIKRKCQLLGAPKLNEQRINDIYMTEGPEPLYQIQIPPLSTFATD